MNRYPKTYRLVALVLLACFLTTVSGLATAAGNDCCGNCGDTARPHAMPGAAAAVSGDCCATTPACTCTFESADDRDLPVHGIAYVNTTGDHPLSGLTATVSTAPSAPGSRQLALVPPGSENLARSGPIYLANQTFLC